jgi:hypothetical protein
MTPVAAPRRDRRGRFVRKSMAQRIVELNARGLRNAEIAKTLGIRPQNVFRALHRGDREVHRVRVDWSETRLSEAKLGECGDLCQTATSDVCECPCEGKNHGIALKLNALDKLAYRNPRQMIQ